jgi:2-polyprenyl-6-methoxyphenol hydroxylase-like FAD-dependent oxidoreductase
MVVGADGIHSTVVNKIFPQTPLPFYTKENIFYGVVENIDRQMNSSVKTKNTLTQYIDRGEFLTYRMGHKGEMMWAATYPSDAPPPTSGDIEWKEINNKRELQSVLKRHPKLHPIHECAASTDPQRLLHFGLYYRQHRNDGWHRGRICLLGDSCHATLPFVGQGANMAMEDAVSLLTSLQKHKFQMEPAFQEYYHQRFNRTKRVVNSARYLGLILHSQNPVVSSLGRRLGPFMMQSNLFMKMAEKEFYNKCPVPMKPPKDV